MTAVIVILVILILLAVVVVLAAVGGYNSMIKLRNTIQESWRQVDVELNRRYELIPNLVETVRAFSAHERNTLEGVTQLRNQAMSVAHAEPGATPSPQRAQLEEQLSGAVHQLMVSVEAYPELKSNQNFLELQRQLAETEDRIANGRRYYNANVRAYNTKVESIPTNIIAGMFKFEKATYFEVNDAAVRQAPSVSFGEIAYRGDAPAAQPAASNELPNPQAQQQWPAQPVQDPVPQAQPQAGQQQWPAQQQPQQPQPGQQQAGQQQQWPAQQQPQPGQQQQWPAQQPSPGQPGQQQWPSQPGGTPQ